jgi:propionyl-CoA carboxylase alpha chain
VHAVAAALSAQAARRAAAPVQGGLPSGWRNVPDLPQRISYREAAEELTVHYVVAPDGSAAAWVRRGPAGDWSIGALEGDLLVSVAAARPDVVDVVVDGTDVRAAVHLLESTAYVDSPLGHSTLVEIPRFPVPGELLAEGSLLSPMPGTVTRVLVAAGDEVTRGAVLLILEAMKMEHPVRSPGHGTVREIGVEAGSQVEAGEVLAVIAPAAVAAEPPANH